MARPAPRAALAAAAIAAGACGGGKVPPAPPPLRPPPRAVHVQPATERTDCEPTAPSDGPAPYTYDERSVEEAENLASQGSNLLQQAAPGEGSAENEQLVEQAVQRLITALMADPYNVNATYNLAAAYARIGRAQCSVNLLARLVPMRKLPSLAPSVEEKLDRLLGRKEYRGKLDPDFFDLRDDPRFRELVKNF